jgi:hypothetical protein
MSRIILAMIVRGHGGYKGCKAQGKKLLSANLP